MKGPRLPPRGPFERSEPNRAFLPLGLCGRGSAAQVACRVVTTLRVGGVRVPRTEAFDHAGRYLTAGLGWGYPAYERYEASRALGPLTDADLLAPPMLNVQHFDLGVYESLQAVQPQLQESLDHIRPAASVFDATDDEREHLRRMFAL